MIEGHVPVEMVHTFCTFLEFCYLVRWNIIDENVIGEIEDALNRFHFYRTVFHDADVVSSFSLPQQHSMMHYASLV